MTGEELDTWVKDAKINADQLSTWLREAKQIQVSNPSHNHNGVETHTNIKKKVSLRYIFKSVHQNCET